MIVRIIFNEDLIMIYPEVANMYNTEDNMLVMNKKENGQQYKPVKIETVQEIYIVDPSYYEQDNEN